METTGNTEEPNFYGEFNSASEFVKTEKGKEVRKIVTYLNSLKDIEKYICNGALKEAVRIVSYAKIC
ncbi:MAG: hypothetical protein COZ16_06000 [Flavobacteriaceae bacterium CG_4_10_14_3_um_filter_31_253]|nr:MAG: hypothetical protein COW43_08895 [Flavobacteriaceae bacterium CG17_big_fil_post_rev_8_21_14_2_50_31_13]PIX14886.1 MAG: hypothetical protein COZ74_01750 [Flavobacteriaceae bacterium CG_4_8_14_3_um_filter_31_8]PIY15062.1 MAG: hypothetical protein COZ16_06000 [Flavobacteriaceae bacterium CG_4_10_14_3_um_filter_31_253]PIZ12403.1 MAG: hypothetical protein COY55_00070 [Flavobacteriaceae bacterium CG_4_10_14_0_8_um_filter_31_99]PJC10083.1 MAG: hypothetical protein CO067_06560 [Flavobacteriacea